MNYKYEVFLNGTLATRCLTFAKAKKVTALYAGKIGQVVKIVVSRGSDLCYTKPLTIATIPDRIK